MAQTDTTLIRAIARWLPKSDAGAGLSKQQAEMVELTAVDAVARLCAGRITATEYAEALLAQIDTHQCLNTFASLDAAKVIEMCLHAQSQVSLKSDHLQASYTCIICCALLLLFPMSALLIITIIFCLQKIITLTAAPILHCSLQCH